MKVLDQVTEYLSTVDFLHDISKLNDVDLKNLKLILHQDYIYVVKLIQDRQNKESN